MANINSDDILSTVPQAIAQLGKKETMFKTRFVFMVACLLIIFLPILTATTISTRAASVSGASADSANPVANTPTDFSSRGRGGGGRGGFGGGRGGGRGGFGGGRGGGRGGFGGGRGGGRVGGGRVGGGRVGGGRVGGGRVGGGRVGGARVGGAGVGGARVGAARVGGARVGAAGVGGARVGGARVGAARVGGARVGAARVGNFTAIHGRRFTTFTGRRLWWNGGWRTLVGVGLLTGWAVGDAFYYPESYVAYSQPLCNGFTDDGCALRWQDVATDDGSTVPQCVRACPRAGSGSVPAAATPAPAAPAAASPRSGCEVAVFQDKNMQGQSFETTEDQPLLNDQWNKNISSIQVISGTWDFSSEPQFGGDAMRLAPGTYRDLGGTWDKQISSFMCVQ